MAGTDHASALPAPAANNPCVFVIRHTTPSAHATQALAAGLAHVLRPGDVVMLEGDLGAGKTTFVHGVAAALGADLAQVSSPTYVLVHVYPLRGSGSLRRLVHVDAYRLTSADDLEPLGWDQLFDPVTRHAAPDAAAVVEWPDRLGDALPPPTACAQVRLEHTMREDEGGGLAPARAISITLPGTFSQRPGVDLLRDRPPILCPTTRVWVAPTSPTYPFAHERARGSDFYAWATGQYALGRPVRPEDDEDHAGSAAPPQP